MELLIIIAIVVIAYLAWTWATHKTEVPTNLVTTEQAETAPYKVPEPAAVTPTPLVVEVAEPAVAPVAEAVAEPVAEKPKRKPAAKTAAAKAPAKAPAKKPVAKKAAAPKVAAKKPAVKKKSA